MKDGAGGGTRTARERTNQAEKAEDRDRIKRRKIDEEHEGQQINWNNLVY